MIKGYKAVYKNGVDGTGKKFEIGKKYHCDGKISFDKIVETMYETGKDLKVMYRETAEGGMAKKFGR